MNTVSQPSAAPTNKLSASLIGMVIGAVIFEVAAGYLPSLREVQISGFGDLSVVTQILVAGVLGYYVKDRPNA